MHELSLCEAVAKTVLAHSSGREVRRVRLRIGHLRQVSPATLQFCWGIAVDATPLDASELDVEHVPAAVRCTECGVSTTLTEPVLRCGGCGGRDVELVAGDEFLIESIELTGPATAGARR